MEVGQHHEVVREAPPDLPSERSTGLVFAAVAAIAAVLLRSMPVAAGGAGVLALLFALIAFLAPHRLAGLNRAWFKLGLLLSRVVSPVVMLVIYGLVIVPAGLIMQRLRDPLQVRGRGTRASYWIERQPDVPLSSMRDQF
jgi:hypothetical protein